jgi:hypothetical protein
MDMISAETSGAQAAAPHSLDERVTALLRRTRYRRAVDASDRHAIARLRYEAYLREAAIDPSATREMLDKYDDAGNAITFGVHIDGRLASSIRLHRVTYEEAFSPAVEVFSDILVKLLEDGRRIVDPNRFVVDRDTARRFPELAFVTLRLPFMAMTALGADVATATVRQEHVAFYQRVLGYRMAAAPRSYPTLVKPLALMIADFRAEETKVLRRYPFFSSSRAERSSVFGDASIGR